ncbi:MAG: nucleotidyltransferase domain-containing protein [Gemmatimonadota bacterium]|nr:nucleotidyltransferase domain-containing protein [Gemmatimonadota bacterium]
MAKLTLDELVAQLRAAFSDALRTVVLFGSAADGEHIPNRSDYNVLVIVDRIDVAELRALSATARAWRDAGNPPPLIFTTEEWREASDVFPMEYADMLERHRVLFGESPFAGIRVSPADLRLQLEHQVRGKLLALRQGTLAAGRDDKAELALLASSLSTIMVMFRAVERLRGVTPSRDNAELSRSVAAAAHIDAEPFLRVVRHVRGESRLAPGDAPGVLDGYLHGMEGVVRWLDGFAAEG